MENFFEPNIHPILVHFAFALGVSAAFAYLLAAFPVAARWRKTLIPAADWMLAFAAVAIIATVAAGFQAYYTVAHDGPSHAAMATHRNWAVPSALLLLALAGWRYMSLRKPLNGVFVGLMAIAAVSLTTTAWWGGTIVYKYGLGVQSLPEVTGDGHDHDHGTVGQSDMPSPIAMNDHDASDGHHEADTAATQHDNSDGHHQSDVEPAQHDNSDGHHDLEAMPIPTTAAEGSPIAIVSAFGNALRTGDEPTLQTLILPNVVIAEGGGTERSFAEYAGHHMPSDMAFIGAVESTMIKRDVLEGIDQATVITESQIHGTFKDQTIHSKMVETMVLQRGDDGWKIAHIHWSSAPITGEHKH